MAPRARRRRTSSSETPAVAPLPSARRSSRRTAASGRSAERRRSPVVARYEQRHAGRASPPARAQCPSGACRLRLGLLVLLACAFEVASRLRQEDVVERRLVEIGTAHV